jgi:hypothetical protein
VWTKRIRHTDPLPAQVAALDRQSVLKLLRVVLGGKFIRRGYELRERTSRWIWSLLARLPDRGEMDYAEVGWIRELGKRAVLMMVSMAQVEALREEVEGDLEGDGDGGHDDGEEEEFVGEMVVDAEDEGGVAAPKEVGDPEARAVGGETESEQPANPAAEDIEDQNGGEADMDIDDGEVTDDEPSAPAGNNDIEADIAAAKARLLARLEEAPGTEQAEPSPTDADENQPNENNEGDIAAADETRARVNMRATLNMILTVAGEFYGQRDLLEFRDPFPSL